MIAMATKDSDVVSVTTAQGPVRSTSIITENDTTVDDILKTVGQSVTLFGAPVDFYSQANQISYSITRSPGQFLFRSFSFVP